MKNGKIFNKISIIDIIVAVALIAIAAGVSFKFLNKVDLPITNANQSYTLEMRAYYLNETDDLSIKEGDIIYTLTGDKLGKVTKATKKPYRSIVSLADGTQANFDDPTFADYYFTVEGTGSVTDKGIYADGKSLIAPGQKFEITSKYFKGQCMIISAKKD